MVGSGKTTVIKQLAEHFGLVRISNDENRKILQDEGFNLTRTTELGFGLAKDFVEKGFGLAIDADCSGPKVIETIKGLAEKNGIKVFLIHLNTPEDFILANLKKFRPEADKFINIYHHRKHLHQNLDFTFDYVFDLSKGDLPRQIEECERIIKEKI
ncbi:MAG: AAA family ATPase [Candidatus Uhrbacteria bacterium]